MMAPRAWPVWLALLLLCGCASSRPARVVGQGWQDDAFRVEVSGQAESARPMLACDAARAFAVEAGKRAAADAWAARLRREGVTAVSYVPPPRILREEEHQAGKRCVVTLEIETAKFGDAKTK